MCLSALVSRQLCRLAIAPILLLVLTACAQQRQPGYYQTAPAGTASDAMHRAQGSSELIAPAQIQLGFGDNKPAKPTQAEAAQAAQAGDTPAAPAGGQPAPAALADTHTFLGTV
ncbi:MAG TPA: hypothetical protein VL024_08015, partial [Castellaniella sp.]|nr:hypothetical protein [Castellaniella sp.]